MLTPYLQGMGTGAGLIIAIGAQNAFVLTQGLKRNHRFVTVCICALSDALLIALGLAGLGTFLADNQLLLQVATWGGAGFLGWYGLRSFRSAWNAGVLESEDRELLSLRAAIATTLAVTYLNPHVYLDTVLLLGSIGGRYPVPERLFFGAGAASASMLWFSLLGFGARVLQPVFRRPAAWTVLDVLVGLTMWSVAFSLIRQGLG